MCVSKPWSTVGTQPLKELAAIFRGETRKVRFSTPEAEVIEFEQEEASEEENEEQDNEGAFAAAAAVSKVLGGSGREVGCFEAILLAAAGGRGANAPKRLVVTRGTAKARSRPQRSQTPVQWRPRNQDRLDSKARDIDVGGFAATLSTAAGVPISDTSCGGQVDKAQQDVDVPEADIDSKTISCRSPLKGEDILFATLSKARRARKPCGGWAPLQGSVHKEAPLKVDQACAKGEAGWFPSLEQLRTSMAVLAWN